MIKPQCFLIIIICNVLISCNKDEDNLKLNPEHELSFNGTFVSSQSEKISGNITLQIANGHYQCFTNLPFGKGAGKIEMDESSINFIDSLFFPIPAIYSPSYILSGKYQYQFDGENLNIWKSNENSEIEYKLYLMK